MTALPSLLTIRVPSQPERVLSPNAPRQTHWATQARERTAQRAAWGWAAVEALDPYGQRPHFTGPVRCRITVYRGKGRKPMDADNLLATMKAGIDQLQTAGVVANDNQLSFLPVVQERDPDGIGYTLVELSAE